MGHWLRRQLGFKALFIEPGVTGTGEPGFFSAHRQNESLLGEKYPTKVAELYLADEIKPFL